MDLEVFINEIRSVNDENCVVILCGNKADLESSSVVSQEEIDSFVNKNQLTYIKTSAKTGNNINEMFNQLTTQLLNKFAKPKQSGFFSWCTLL